MEEKQMKNCIKIQPWKQKQRERQRDDDQPPMMNLFINCFHYWSTPPGVPAIQGLLEDKNTELLICD